MKKNITYLIIIISSLSVTYLVAFSSRVSRIPNGSENTCANCHINPGGGGARNSFGQSAASFIASGGSESFWGPQIAALDSDGDGFTNGEELQDPNGEWIPGTASPGDINFVTNPGDPNDFPVSVNQLAEIPNDYKLGNNYPNPFNPTTTISFSIPENSDVLLEVYNTLGENVRMLVNGNYSSGSYSTRWNGRDDFGREVNSGVYIYRIVAANFVDSKRMILMK
jgi:hypothetical protein